MANFSNQMTLDKFTRKQNNFPTTEEPKKKAKTSIVSNNNQDYIKANSPLEWKKIENINLDLDYTILFSKSQANNIFQLLENQIEYYEDDLMKVKVFGKWHKIPRKQVSYGDTGLSYTFSGNTFPALPWTHLTSALRDLVNTTTGSNFNFLLINRYKDGNDHIGEHRDNEKDLIRDAPIVSLSFGQVRDFIFRHKDCRRKDSANKIAPVKMQLEHGSLLVMNHPTNDYWYHSLPVRKQALHTRVNLTFRRIKN